MKLGWPCTAVLTGEAKCEAESNVNLFVSFLRAVEISISCGDSSLDKRFCYGVKRLFTASTLGAISLDCNLNIDILILNIHNVGQQNDRQ